MQNILRLQTLVSLALISFCTLQTQARADSEDGIRFRFQRVPIPAGSTFFVGTGINKKGLIVGYNGNGDGNLAGSLLKGNRFSNVGFPSTPSMSIQASFPFGIAKNDMVVGMAYEFAGTGHAYTLSKNRYVELIYPNSVLGGTSIRAVSSDGKILGDASINVEPYFLDFIYKNGVFTPLSLPPNPPAQNIYWYSINKHGTLLGLGNDVNGAPVLVTANASGYELLPALPVNFQATPVSILDSGDIVCNGYNLAVFDPALGYGTAGLLLHDGQWTQICHPLDTLGYTQITGAGEHSSDGAAVVGNYWNVAQQKLIPFSARGEDSSCD